MTIVNVPTATTILCSAKGHIRLFDVYEDRIEVYAYSPWTNKMYTGPLDHFTTELSSSNHDVDGDLWTDESDIMPTHPLVPDAIVAWLATMIGGSACWAAQYLSKRRKGLEAQI